MPFGRPDHPRPRGFVPQVEGVQSDRRICLRPEAWQCDPWESSLLVTTLYDAVRRARGCDTGKLTMIFPGIPRGSCGLTIFLHFQGWAQPLCGQSLAGEYCFELLRLGPR